MTKRTSVFAVWVTTIGLLLAGAAFAGEAGQADSAKKGKSHDLMVTVVSADTEANTITFKTEEGEEKTAPVMESARGSLGGLTAGEKVKLTCWDNAEGEHLGVTAIKKP